jgi:hypothetical protein
MFENEKKSDLILFLSISFSNIIAESKAEIFKKCFIKTTPKLINDYIDFLYSRILTCGYRRSERVVIIDTQHFEKKKLNFLFYRDKIIRIDNCSMVTEFSSESDEIYNQNVSKNYLSKVNLLFAASSIDDIPICKSNYPILHKEIIRSGLFK